MTGTNLMIPPTTRAMRRQRAVSPLLMLVGVALLAVLGWWGFATFAGPASGSDESEQRDWAEVRRQSFDIIVAASGEIDAENRIEIKNQVERPTTIIELVDEGASVKKGDVLVRLSDDELRDRLSQERLSVEQAISDKVAAEENLEIERGDAANALDAAERRIEMATLDRDRWFRGTDPQKQRELELELEKARRNLDRARRDLEDSRKLYEERFISLSEMEDDEIRVIEAENTYATAQLNVEVYQKYTRPKELTQVEADLDNARAELERVRRQNASQLAKAEATLRGRIGTLEIREDQLKKLEEQLAHTVITAPADGLVVYATSTGGRFRRGDPIAQGKQVRFNESLIILPDTSQMVARVRVHEAMVPNVRPNQRAAVTIDARPGEPMDAVVRRVGVMAEDGGWMNPQLREYVVTISLPPGDGELLKPSMRCSARIFTGRVEDGLAAPVQAVFAEGRQRFVYVDADRAGRVKRQAVRVGRSSETMVEIIDGVAEGERVLLRRPRPGEVLGEEDGAAAESASDEAPGMNGEAAQGAAPADGAMGRPATPGGGRPAGAEGAAPADGQRRQWSGQRGEGGAAPTEAQRRQWAAQRGQGDAGGGRPGQPDADAGAGTPTGEGGPASAGQAAGQDQASDEAAAEAQPQTESQQPAGDSPQRPIRPQPESAAP